MPLGHHYPWQWLTRRHPLRLMQRVERSFDPQRLREDFRAIADHYRLRPHFLTHDGASDVVALVAPYGDPTRDRKQDGPYQKTEVLRVAPYLEEIIDSFRCATQRVRIMRLAPGGRMVWHYDWDETLDHGNARLHIPIETNERAWSQLSHLDYHWRPGECWYGDFSFPHRLVNRSEQPRVHLVIDAVRNEFIDALLADVLADPPELRARVRRRAQWLMTHLARRPRRRLQKFVQRISSARNAASSYGP